MSKRTVLYVVEGPGNAQFRYQLMNITEALKNSSKWRVKWVLINEVKEEDLKDIAFMVISRQTAKGNTVPNLIKKAHEKGIKVLFTLDDLIFDYRDVFVLNKGTGGRRIFFWAGYIFAVRRIATKVDGFIATNQFLADKLERSFKKPCAIIPNSLNKAQVDLSEKCLNKKIRQENFTVGYFSGSPTHAKDLEMVEEEILSFLDDYNNVKLRLVGMIKLSNAMKKRVEMGRVEIIGMVDYLEQMKLMAEIDVNIAPLVINDFTNCKSELKFFEAAIVETTTIASPSYAFRYAIENGKNGFLAQPGDWYDKLKFLYLHPETNQKLAKSARKYALENYYGKKFLEAVESAYNHFVI